MLGLLALTGAVAIAPSAGARDWLTVASTPRTPARGVILVARETLGDPRFAHAVVLLTDYGFGGAAGVILNRPTDVRVVDAIPAFAPYLSDPAQTMYYGGPVEPGRARVLILADEPVGDAKPVLENVYAVQRMSLLAPLLERADVVRRSRFYGGYTGWGPGQLEHEIRRGDWRLARGTVERVFSEHPEALWEDLDLEHSGLWVENRRSPSPTGGTPGVCESGHGSHSIGAPHRCSNPIIGRATMAAEYQPRHAKERPPGARDDAAS